MHIANSMLIFILGYKVAANLYASNYLIQKTYKIIIRL